MDPYLGIDIGTGKCAAVLVRPGQAGPIAAEARAHRADRGAGLQDGARLIEAAGECVRALPAEGRAGARGVAVTGQMHGVVGWNADGAAATPLHTWQSAVDDLESLRALPGCSGLRHGYGGATLGAAQRDAGGFAGRFSGTIQDYLVWLLCGNPATALIDATDAASWGFFDARAGVFDPVAVEALGIAPERLPTVVAPGSRAGVLSAEWARAWGLPAGIEVKAAIGDNQASVLATARRPEREVYLTLGTGGQISLLVPARDYDRYEGRVELRPYPGGDFLAVGAPLCGGDSWAALIRYGKSALEAFGMEAGEPGDLYRATDAAAARVLEAPDFDASSLPDFTPRFLGERDGPEQRASLSGLSLENFRFDRVAAALALGTLRNLRSMMPEELLRGRDVLFGSGNAFRLNRSLRLAAEKVFGFPLTMPEGREEAAVGATRLFFPKDRG